MPNPKKVPPPPPPAIRSVRVTLEFPTPPTTAPKVTLISDTGASMVGQWIPASGFDICDLPNSWPAPFGAHLLIECEGYQTIRRDFMLADFSLIPPAQLKPEVRIQTLDFANNAPLSFVMVAAQAPVRPLRVDGLFFTTDDGQPWTQIGCSSFRLYDLWLRERATAIGLMEHYAGFGFNQVRVFLMCDWMWKFNPAAFGDAFYDGLMPFQEDLAGHGLGAELTVFVDARNVMPDLNQQIAHWRKTAARVRGSSQLERTNENDQAINTIADMAFQPPPPGVIWSRGSNGADAPPVGCSWNLNPDGSIAGGRIDLPQGSYIVQHPSRPADWPRRVGHNTQDWTDVTHTPGTTNETCRPDQGRGPIPSDFFDAAANAALLCAGATFHSDSGKFSRQFTPQEAACARAWVEGAKAVPLGYRTGRYIAGHLGGFPVAWAKEDSSRAHGKQLGNRACLSLPQMRDGYVPHGIDGWRVVKQIGSVVECERS